MGRALLVQARGRLLTWWTTRPAEYNFRIIFTQLIVCFFSYNYNDMNKDITGGGATS